MIEQQRVMRLNDKFYAGKYKGRCLQWVIDKNPEAVTFMVERGYVVIKDSITIDYVKLKAKRRGAK